MMDEVFRLDVALADIRRRLSRVDHLPDDDERVARLVDELLVLKEDRRHAVARVPQRVRRRWGTDDAALRV